MAITTEKKKNISLKDIEKLKRDMENAIEDQSEDLFNSLSSRYIAKTQNKFEEETVVEEEKKEKTSENKAVSAETQEKFFNDIFASKDEEIAAEEEEAAEEEPEEMAEPAHAFTSPRTEPHPQPASTRSQGISLRRIKGGRKVEIKFEVRKGQAKTESYVAIEVMDLNTNEKLFTKNLPVYPEMLDTPVVIRQGSAQNIPFGFKVHAGKTKNGMAIPLIHFDYPADMEPFTVQPISFLGNSPIWEFRYGIEKSGDAKLESVIYPSSQMKIKESVVINTTEEGHIIIQDK